MTETEQRTEDLVVTWNTSYGCSWSPDPAAATALHSHALRVDDSVWVIDPIDGPTLDELLIDLGGDVTDVVVLLDRHMRDSIAVAARHDARLHVVAGSLRQAVPEHALRFDDELDGSPFTVVPVREMAKVWNERALWWAEHDLLVIAESVGSARGFVGSADGALAVHPMLRLTPPRASFAQAAPKVVLCGHGAPVEDDATDELRHALEVSRRGTPKLAVDMIGAAVNALRARHR